MPKTTPPDGFKRSAFSMYVLESPIDDPVPLDKTGIKIDPQSGAGGDLDSAITWQKG